MSLLRPRWLQRVTDGAVDLLFPANCFACEQPLREPRDRIAYCTDCQFEMARGDWPVCGRCAARVPRIPGAVPNCPRCRDAKLRFDRALALGEYEGLLRDQLLAMKHDRSERIANSLGMWMAARFEEQLREPPVDAILPAPMHAWRRLANGTNGPAALARTLGRELDLPVLPRLLRLRRNMPRQVGLSQPARFRNVRGEMHVHPRPDVRGKHLLLVDDILTTGATASEAARVLQRAGAARITVLVVARTAE